MDYTAQVATRSASRHGWSSSPSPAAIYFTEHTAKLVEGYLALRDLGEIRGQGRKRAAARLRARGRRGGSGRRSTFPARAAFRASSDATSEMAALEARSSRRFRGTRQVVGVVAEAGRRQEPSLLRVRRACRARGIPVYDVAGLAHRKSVPLLADARAPARLLRDHRAGFRPDGAREDRRADCAARRELRRAPSLDLRLPRRARPRAAPAADGPGGAAAPALDVDQAPEPRRERPRAGRHPVRGPSLVRSGKRGLPGVTSMRCQGREACCSSTSGPSTTRRGCRGPTTSSSPLLRSAPRRSTSCLRICSADDPSLDATRRARPRAHRRQSLLHRGDRAVAGREREPRGERGAYRLVEPRGRARRCPPRVQAVLAARIDRLARAREAGAADGGGDRQGVLRADPASASIDLDATETRRRASQRSWRAEFVYEQRSIPRPITPSSTR